MLMMISLMTIVLISVIFAHIGHMPNSLRLFQLLSTYCIVIYV